ncbi:CCCH zinc finger and RRM domain protein [Aspergillus lucknowensis]|uniref:CCCH zinc finger and RRM domain protein n=1 Tax=Aspergillus lucknowensis TaxID=176173 RepID=A0ABR4L986_9EURO
MQLTEDKAAEVKNWVVKKLEDISDADSDVLADYVLALIRSDAPDEEIRKASVEHLEDFLMEHTTEFVDTLFATFAPKQLPSSASNTPGQVQLPQGPGSAPQTGAPTKPLTGPFHGPYASQAHVENSFNAGRKRTYNDGFGGEPERDGVGNHRTFKNPRRGRGGRGDWMGRDGHAASGAPAQFPHPSPGGFPVMPPAFPGFDQNDPMAAMMALQNMGFPQMSGIPPMPMPPAGTVAGQQGEQIGPKSTEKCPFYETQGICYLGAACPYQHDVAQGAPRPNEYDPKSSNIVADFQRRSSEAPTRGHDRGRGRGRGRGGDRGGFANRGRRSEFSSAGPSDDPSVKTIVVEQIPDDKLDDFTVREFFSQYGEITDISLQPHKKLALITYGDHEAAKRAWSSPKVIFDNRFVKVYWHKSKGERNHDQRAGPHDNREGTQSFNAEEFERQQEEAQKAHEEKLKRRQETEQAKQALEKQREELLKKQEEEKRRLLQKIGGTTSSSASPDGAASQSPSGENASEQTKQLRAQLAALEAEAKMLGLDPHNPASTTQASRGRGRGGYFGARGGYAPRGRGYDPSFRGSSRGRGGGFPARGRGGVLRLDNRPKRVAVSGIKPNSEQDEAFRQFLIGVGEYDSITPNPDANDPDSLIIAFKERYIAEKFMYGARNIPSVGEIQLSWVQNPPLPAPSPSTQQPHESQPHTAAGLDTKAVSDDDTVMDSAPGAEPTADQAGRGKDGHAAANADVDYDVAEVDDSWGVE